MQTADELARWRRRFDRWTIGVFLVLVCAPLADEVVRDRETRGPEEYELRSAAPKPRLRWTVAELNEYPSAYESWYADQFGLRDKLIGAKSIERLFLFGVSPTPRVELGKDNWMFYTGDYSRTVFMGERPFDELQIGAWLEMFANHAEVCASFGAQSLFVLGPNKETIYPDYAPTGWRKTGPSRFEQLAEHFARTPPQNFLDLRPALTAARAGDTPADHVYFELGTHWNGRGSFTATNAILGALADRGFAVKPMPWEQMIVIPAAGQGDTWARAMYIAPLVPQNNLWVAPPQVGSLTKQGTLPDGRRETILVGLDPSAPKALMFHDSFGESIMTLLSPHFSRLRCIWSPLTDTKLIAEERPDVVIEVFVERALVSLYPSDCMLASSDIAKDHWSRATRTVFVLDPSRPGDVQRRGSVAVSSASGDVPGLQLDMPDNSGSIVLPRFELPEQGDLLIRFQVDASRATEFVLLPVYRGEVEPRRGRAARVDVPAGSSEQFVRLFRHEKLERVLVHPAAGQARYVIRELEVRAMPGL